MTGFTAENLCQLVVKNGLAEIFFVGKVLFGMAAEEERADLSELTSLNNIH